MKKIYKLLITVIIVTAFFPVLSFIASAEEITLDIEDFGGKEIYESTPDDVNEMLEKIGIESVDFDSVFNVKAKDLINLLGSLITDAASSPLRSSMRLLAVIVILTVFECFIPKDSKLLQVSEFAANLLCVICIVKPVSYSVSCAVASIDAAEKFMLVLIPVLTSVISLSGNPSLAVSFQSVAFVGAQVISAIAVKFIVPVVGVIFALDITGSIAPKFKLSALTGTIKKLLTSVLSFSSTIFVSFLGLKAGLANSADSMVSKSVKFVISSAVPVVGNALSEAYSGVTGSMVLVKSTLGVFGICTVALVTLPSCIQLLFWIFALKIMSGIAEMFELDGVGNLLKSLSSSLVLLNIVLVFVAVLFIISTTLVLLLKAG